MDNLDFDKPFQHFHREHRGKHLTTFQSVQPNPSVLKLVAADLVQNDNYDHTHLNIYPSNPYHGLHLTKLFNKVVWSLKNITNQMWTYFVTY